MEREGRSRAPLWLSAPSRFAGLPRPRARLVLGLVALLLIGCWTALFVAPPPPAQGANAMTDVALYESIVASVRHGGDYYAAAAHALRTGEYPLRPFLTFRLPTLAVLQGALPEWAPPAMLYLLAAAVAVAWFARLRDALPRRVPILVAMALLAGGMLVFVEADLVMFHEIWAAPLIALSLALRRQGRWIEPVAIGMIAMLFRETAALYVVLMAGMAWLEGERREAGGWAAALGLFALVLAAHAYAVAGVTGPLDPASPGWAGLHGYGFFVKTLTLATALQLAPLWLAAPFVGLALFGWASWNTPLALRALTIFTAYAAAIGIFGRLDTFYWGLMIAPVFLVGLVFVPDGLRDLAAAALDTRRVRVQRITR
jgi:hypothetical protein